MEAIRLTDERLEEQAVYRFLGAEQAPRPALRSSLEAELDCVSNIPLRESPQCMLRYAAFTRACADAHPARPARMRSSHALGGMPTSRRKALLKV
jgi:hypothetical protein